MKKFRTLFIFLSIFVVIAAVIAFGIFSGNGFDFTTIFSPFIKLFLSFIQFVQNFIANPSFAFPEVLYLVSIAVSPLLALYLLILGIVRKDFFAAVLGFISPLLFVYALVGLFIPYYPNIPTNLNDARPYIEIFINDLNSNLTRAVIFGFVFGMSILVSFVLMVTFLFGGRQRRRLKTKALQKPQDESGNQPPLNAAGLPLQSTIPVAPTPTNSTNQDGQLADLIKLVMAEELSAMRTGYPQVMNPGYGGNMMPGTPYGVDINLVRRIVVEELAKFQGHYISRPEVQTLIAQEIALIKAQLKIK